MTRTELYFDIVNTLIDADFDGDLYACNSADEVFLANKIFSVVTSTKDPELAWNLFKLDYKSYDGFFADFMDNDIKPGEVDELIDFIEGDASLKTSKYSY